MKKIYFLVLIISFFFLSGCNDESPEKDTFQRTLKILNEEDNEITVAPKGISLKLNFLFHNVTDKTQKVRFTDSQQYDLEIYNSQGVLVWNWANGKGFTTALTELVFTPGEVKTFEEIWDQTSNEGVQVPVGFYNVYVNRTLNADMPAGPVQIEIDDSIVGNWIWYETSGGIGGITETPESTGETRKVVFQDNGNVTFFTNDIITLASTYSLASEDTIISNDPLPVVKIEGIDSFYYIYSFPDENELELQENVNDGFIYNYRKAL
jgi:hypothetical protein